MSRDERWSSEREIRRSFRSTADPQGGAGPIVYASQSLRLCDDSEAHVCVIGKTGKGKSQCCTLPCLREILRKGESAIVLDPKEECWNLEACWVPQDYQVFCVNLRTPRRSPHRWNPLAMPYRLFASGDPEGLDAACSQVSELWNGVYPYDGKGDKFWPDSAANYAKGLTYSLFETAAPEEVHLDSVAAMMEHSELRLGGDTSLKMFYNTLPDGSLSKRSLASYVSAPNDTRASIHSVAASGIEVFSRSRGLMELLSEDTLNILDLDLDRPFLLMIVLPDETDAYDALAGLLVSQMTQHLIQAAQDRGGRLPIRANVILEELGSIGRSIPNLPNLAAASRSRNIRLMLILQSSSQLRDLYGPSRAEAILACVGLTIGFSTNSWETLTEWSQRCGARRREVLPGQVLAVEPLITASQLAAMPTGTALILSDGRCKFISRLPCYDQLYDNAAWRPPALPPARGSGRARTLDFKAMVDQRVQARINLLLRTGDGRKSRRPSPPRERPWMPPLDLDDLLSKIDRRIEELNEEEGGDPDT